VNPLVVGSNPTGPIPQPWPSPRVGPSRKTGLFRSIYAIEANANSFASQLVLPDYLVVNWIGAQKPSLDVASKVASDFKSSLTAAAIKLARKSITACVRSLL
jgi:hypothetical protein